MFTGYTYADPANPAAPRDQEERRVLRARHGALTRPRRTPATNLEPRRCSNGVPVLPADQTPQQDLDAAVQQRVHASEHAGRTSAKQLIQRLVTGNPSPAYVARIAAVFNEQRRRACAAT